jgi:hypothetical protein
MDRESAAGAFSLEGISDREIRWSGGDTVMEVHPVKSLNPWTVYRWTLGSGARGANGVPLGRELGGRFVTDADRNRPEVRETYPLLPGGPESGSRWIKTGAALTDGLGSGQALGIEFSKPMDESLVRHLRFDPPLAGRAEMWKDRAVVFIPDRDPEPERTYTLYVSAESRDTGGLKMEKDFVLSFIPDIPRLAVASLEAGGPAAGAPVPGGIYTAAVIAPEGIATVTLRFSRAVDPRARADAVLALRLEPYFPGNLRPVSFRSARWWAADTVVLQWEGLEGGTPGEKHYYRLFLPGGRGGISDGKGSYLEEDTVFFLEGVY